MMHYLTLSILDFKCIGAMLVIKYTASLCATHGAWYTYYHVACIYYQHEIQELQKTVQFKRKTR